MAEERLSVTKFRVKESVIIVDKLFLEGDVVYIQQSDPIAGKSQMVFAEDKSLVGSISSSYYWSLMDKIKKF